MHRLEKALGALVLLTFIAIIGEHRILKTSLVIEPFAGFTTVVYADGTSGGNSTIEYIDEKLFKWRCTLRSQYDYPYCGFEVVFDEERQQGLDLTNFNRIRIWLDYEGPGRTVRIYARNFDPAYSTPGENVTAKYNQVEFGTAMLDKPIELDLADFFVANWWIQENNIPPRLSHPQFDNIVSLEVQTGSTSESGQGLGTHQFQLHRIEMTGQIVSTERWYQLITATWLIIALLFLSTRTFGLTRELRRQRAREQELMEINRLLDARGKQLEELAKTDPLTGVFNRQGIKEALRTGLVEWRRDSKPLSCVMLDVDHFKQINDTYGHAVGDRILAGLSGLVQDRIRKVDVFARWGGEEFLLVCRNTSAADAAKIAEKLRRTIEGHDFDGIKVTVSFGVAALSERESLDQLFVRADTALYQAKGNGRNTVSVDAGEQLTQLKSAS